MACPIPQGGHNNIFGNRKWDRTCERCGCSATIQMYNVQRGSNTAYKYFSCRPTRCRLGCGLFKAYLCNLHQLQFTEVRQLIFVVFCTIFQVCRGSSYQIMLSYVSLDACKNTQGIFLGYQGAFAAYAEKSEQYRHKTVRRDYPDNDIENAGKS